MLQLKQQNAGSRAEWLVETRYTFGTGTDNHYKVDGEGVKDIHAGLEVSGDNLQLFNLAGGECVKHNGEVVEKNVQVQAGDEFSVGDAIFIIEDPKARRQSRPKPIPAELSSWTLKAQNTALANKSITLEGTQTIGRSQECDICLCVVHLSRRHAQISVKTNYLQVDDLNSSNGTFVNGKRVTTAQVRSGDEIGFDTLKFTVIGPRDSLEKTQVRTANVDSDATTMRPMIQPADLKAKGTQSAPPKSPSHKESPTKESSSPSQKKNAPQAEQATTNISAETTEQEEKNGSGMIIATVLLLVVAGAATYFLLS